MPVAAHHLLVMLSFFTPPPRKAIGANLSPKLWAMIRILFQKTVWTMKNYRFFLWT